MECITYCAGILMLGFRSYSNKQFTRAGKVNCPHFRNALIRIAIETEAVKVEIFLLLKYTGWKGNKWHYFNLLFML